jgi:hypothetical protein
MCKHPKVSEEKPKLRVKKVQKKISKIMVKIKGGKAEFLIAQIALIVS